MDKFIYILLVFFIIKCALCSKSNDECFLLPSQDKICNVYKTRPAWHYDPSVHECKSFVDYGCDNTSNVYDTEDACYAKCSEKLITLHPAWDLRVVVVQHNSAALIWYSPSNYILHQQFENQSVSNNQTGEYKTLNQSHTSAGDGLIHVVLHKPEHGPNIINNNISADMLGTNTTHSNITEPKMNKDNSSSVINSTSGTGEKVTNGSITTPSSVSDKQPTSPKQNSDIVSPNTTTEDGSSPAAPKPTSTPKAAPSSDGTPTPEATPPSPEEDLEGGGRNLSLNDFIGKIKVPFHFARLTHYILSYKAVRWTQWKNVTVARDANFYNLTGLSPSTAYLMRLYAVYQTNTTLSTEVAQFSTWKHPSEARNCHCDKYGTIGGEKMCNMSIQQLPWCGCRPGYGGLFCETCARGYYRIGPTRSCHKCPCTMESSTGSCHFVAGYLHCLQCREAYAGILCHRCGNGYYRDYSTSTATCKKCDGCHNISPGLVCDPFTVLICPPQGWRAHPICSTKGTVLLFTTGKCLNCHFNTTGERCDKCLPGFKGDPLNKIPCLPVSEKSGFKPPANGVIASIVVGVIVLLSGIVGIIVYRRIQQSPVNKQFWTIEFQEDHEGVNFSSVPNDDADRNVEDLQFYEDVQKSSSKSQPYSRLHEDL